MLVTTLYFLSSCTATLMYTSLKKYFVSLTHYEFFFCSLHSYGKTLVLKSWKSSEVNNGNDISNIKIAVFFLCIKNVKYISINYYLTIKRRFYI